MPEIVLVSLIDRMKMPIISAVALGDPQATADELAATAARLEIPGCVGAVAEHQIACRKCGCTEDHACMTPHGPCSWVEPDLCSACVPQPRRR